MKVALIDNGSLEPAAHRNLRAVASQLSDRAGIHVTAVSWKHSDRVPPDALGGERAWTLSSFIRERTAQGEREFVFVPFFISAQGAIGSALRIDLEKLQRELGGFEFSFSDGLAARDALVPILVDRIRVMIAVHNLHHPSVVVVDHGGPSAVSASLRNEVVAHVRRILGIEVGRIEAASMEGEDCAHNRPILKELLNTPPFERGDVVIAPLFMAAGRHAGVEGDLARAASAAASQSADPTLKYHFADLIGTHPRVVEILTPALHDTLSSLHVHPFA